MFMEFILLHAIDIFIRSVFKEFILLTTPVSSALSIQDSLGGNSKTVMIGNLSCQRLLHFLSFYLEFANISGIENSSPRIFVSLQKRLKKVLLQLTLA